VKHLEIPTEGGYHRLVSQTDKIFYIKKSIYVALLVLRQENRNENKFISVLYFKILSQFVKPPSDTLLCFNIHYPLPLINTSHFI
jgi:hypothetical protein